MKKNFAEYDAEDFVLEESFHNWALDPNSSHHYFWEQYLSQHPEQADTIQLAREMALALNQMHTSVPDQEMADSIWRSIQAEIQAMPKEMSCELLAH